MPREKAIVQKYFPWRKVLFHSFLALCFMAATSFVLYGLELRNYRALLDRLYVDNNQASQENLVLEVETYKTATIPQFFARYGFIDFSPLDAFLCSVYPDLRQWTAALQACADAIEKGTEKAQDVTLLLYNRGIAYLRALYEEGLPRGTIRLALEDFKLSLPIEHARRYTEEILLLLETKKEEEERSEDGIPGDSQLSDPFGDPRGADEPQGF